MHWLIRKAFEAPLDSLVYWDNLKQFDLLGSDSFVNWDAIRQFGK